MSNSEKKTKQEPNYKVGGIPIHAYLIETGEFRWIPTAQACGDRENAKRIIEVLKGMPKDRRAVWASRIDANQTKKRCPVIREEADLCKEFDEFCATYNNPKMKNTDNNKGGELQK